MTSQFWQATAPAAQSDGSRIVFLGKSNRGPQKASLYWVPSTGGDTTSAGIVIPVGISTNTVLGPARFEPTGSFLAYSTDTIGLNLTRPKPWIRDLEVPAQPIPVLPGANTTSEQNAYLNPSWNPNGDSIVVDGIGGRGAETRLQLLAALRFYVPPVIGYLESGSPATRAGLQLGDTVIRARG